eukprot:scaffold11478_cov70-Cylindrotheca_fusiformis.AAC.1
MQPSSLKDASSSSHRHRHHSSSLKSSKQHPKLRTLFLLIIAYSLGWTARILRDNNSIIIGYEDWFGQQLLLDLPKNNNKNKKTFADRMLQQQQQQMENMAINVQQQEGERCALCFFGLPRSYKTMVLPSIRKNILQPNARYNCDVFVHFFYKEKEDAGRFNDGGIIDPTEILLLEDAVQQVMKPSASTIIRFVNDTEKEFFQKRKVQLHRYATAIEPIRKRRLYYPWRENDWSFESQVNVVKQWHSIDAVFDLMTLYHGASNNNTTYTRVGMFRNDVMFLTPIDIFHLGSGSKNTNTNHPIWDEGNNHFVIPDFANHPVNDRMVYGPYEAVKIWATKRFELIEERAKIPAFAGRVLHSERFLKHSIIPRMEKVVSSDKVLNPDICFVRTRPNSVAIYNDCILGKTTNTSSSSSFQEEEEYWIQQIEEIYGQPCPNRITSDSLLGVAYLKC